MTRQIGSLQHDPDRPLGLVLSGGGARGAFQVGVWDVLRKHPRGVRAAPMIISGTSAGAINGGLIAAGLEPDDMLAFWLDLAERPPVVANESLLRSVRRNLARLLVLEPFRGLGKRRRSVGILRGAMRKYPFGRLSSLMALAMEYVMTARYDNVSALLHRIQTAHLFSTEPFRERLISAIGGERITEPRCRLAINTVDVHSGKVIRFVNFQPMVHAEADEEIYHYTPEISVDMIRASSAIPLLFDSVEVDGMELWDGGLLVNTPIAPAVGLGARKIIPVLVTSPRAEHRSGELTFGVGVERLADAFLENAYNTDRKLLLERNRLARVAPERGLAVVQLFEAIRPESSETFDAGSYLYFSPGPIREMFHAGRNAARHWLAAGPLLDTHPGPEKALDPRPEHWH